MTTSTLTLTSFLLARIAEDEAAARDAAHPRGEGWTTRYHEVFFERRTDDGRKIKVADAGNLGLAPAAHIARHDPARVLAECEAKRRIVRFSVGEHNEDDVLFALAEIYADHPDFNPDWRS